MKNVSLILLQPYCHTMLSYHVICIFYNIIIHFLQTSNKKKEILKK